MKRLIFIMLMIWANCIMAQKGDIYVNTHKSAKDAKFKATDNVRVGNGAKMVIDSGYYECKDLYLAGGDISFEKNAVLKVNKLNFTKIQDWVALMYGINKVDGIIDMTNGGTLVVNNFQADDKGIGKLISGRGIVQITSGGQIPDDLVQFNTLVLNNGNVILNANTSISGGVYCYGKLTLGNNQLILNGEQVQEIYSMNPLQLSKLKIDKKGGVINCRADIELEHELLFEKGVLRFTPPYFIHFSDQANVINANDSSHIEGRAKKTIAEGSFVFPFGNNAQFRGLKLDVCSNEMITWEGQYYNIGYSDTTKDSTIEKISTQEYWTLKPNNPSQVKISLVGDDDGFNDFEEEDKDLVLCHYNGYKWEAMKGKSDNGYIHADTCWSNFSPFTLGILKQDVSNLPVELLYFKASVLKENIVLTWATASELNNDYFTVDKSMNNKDYKTIAKIQGNGTTNNKNEYSIVDDSPFANNYYKLTQVDFDGKSETFKPIYIRYNHMKVDIAVVYPNPFKTSLNVEFELSSVCDIELVVANEMGNYVYHDLVPSYEGKNHIILDLSEIKAEKYILMLFYKQELLLTKKIIKWQ